MKPGVFNNQYYLPVGPHPVLQPVLTQQLQQELNQLLTSLRKQVRNVIAVGSWLKRHQEQAAGQPRAAQLPELQTSGPEELSFHLKASPEAFALFTQTLRRRNVYLYAHARVDEVNQILKVQVDFRNLSAWEYEMSILLEQITPEAYLETLLYDRQLIFDQQLFRVPERKAG